MREIYEPRETAIEKGWEKKSRPWGVRGVMDD